MKRLIILLAGLALPFLLIAQANDPVENLFNKYSGKDGFTTVYISSKMLGLFSQENTGDKDVDNLLSNLKSIRILTVEDSLLNNKVNFYSELQKGTGLSGYEELMLVKESNGITVFLTREKDNRIAELLIISSGKDNNSLISIRGSMNLNDISKLSEKVGIEQLDKLDKLENSKKKDNQ
ncbi:MAG: DUF4252 domain-containing protein [Bacteroidales bacterium]